jgi:hypothetical protein
MGLGCIGLWFRPRVTLWNLFGLEYSAIQVNQSRDLSPSD